MLHQVSSRSRVLLFSCKAQLTVEWCKLDPVVLPKGTELWPSRPTYGHRTLTQSSSLRGRTLTQSSFLRAQNSLTGHLHIGVRKNTSNDISLFPCFPLVVHSTRCNILTKVPFERTAEAQILHDYYWDKSEVLNLLHISGLIPTLSYWNLMTQSV